MVQKMLLAVSMMSSCGIGGWPIERLASMLKPFGEGDR